MSSTATASNTTAPTQILQVGSHSYAYRRFGNGPGLPLLSLQHFTGTLDNWDPAVSDPLASGREVILFDNAGIGRSSGEVPETVAGMATHVMAFLDGLHRETDAAKGRPRPARRARRGQGADYGVPGVGARRRRALRGLERPASPHTGRAGLP